MADKFVIYGSLIAFAFGCIWTFYGNDKDWSGLMGQTSLIIGIAGILAICLLPDKESSPSAPAESEPIIDETAPFGQ
jgi:hypothetical protein